MEQRNKKDLLVVKVGTNVLADTSGEYPTLNDQSFENIGAEIESLTNDETGVVLVSSAAVAAGVGSKKLRREGITPTTKLQRYASMGWPIIIQRWQQAISERTVVSTLLTKHDLHTYKSREEALGMIALCLLEENDVVLTNENDTIDPSEIEFGDNDTLAAELASKLALSGLYRSTKLILLTNTNGLNEVPSDNNTLLRTVEDINAVKQFAGDAMSGHSRGGMITKVRAAETAKAAGIETYIANGKQEQAIRKALSKEVGTYFPV